MSPISASTVVLVIGATSGIGKALAELLASAPVAPKHVYIAGRRAELLDEIAALHKNVTAVVFDASNLTGIVPFVGKMVKENGVDFVVFNAGIQRMHDFTAPEEVDLSLFDQEMLVNFTAPVAFTKALLSLYNAPDSKFQQATIAFVTSGLALFPLPRSPAYSASKAALRSFILAVRRQLGTIEKNVVQLIEVLPPAVETELHDLKHQPLLGRDKVAHLAVPLEEYATDLANRLIKGEEDEIAYGTASTGLQKIGSLQRYMVEKVMPAGV